MSTNYSVPGTVLSSLFPSSHLILTANWMVGNIVNLSTDEPVRVREVKSSSQSHTAGPSHIPACLSKVCACYLQLDSPIERAFREGSPQPHAGAFVAQSEIAPCTATALWSPPAWPCPVISAPPCTRALLYPLPSRAPNLQRFGRQAGGSWPTAIPLSNLDGWPLRRLHRLLSDPPEHLSLVPSLGLCTRPLPQAWSFPPPQTLGT